VSRSSDSLDATTERLRRFQQSRGWSSAHTPRNLAVSISIEVGELLEHFQWDEVTAQDRVRRPERFTAMSEELADVVIYALQLADSVELDLLEAVDAKIAKNVARFPAQARSAA
jgi:dCTP diphosphatase